MKNGIKFGGLCFAVLGMVWAVMQMGERRTAYAAGPWYVSNSGNDSNACTSAATACASINGALNKPGFVVGDTVNVAVGTYTGIGTEVVLLNQSATLSGGWNSAFTTQSGTSTIDGQSGRRGIKINGGVTATIEHFTIQNGSFASYGGGIYNAGTSLTMNNSSIINNTTTGDGGGINTSGTTTLSNSTVSGNTANSGGGIYNSNYDAGGLGNPGVLTLNGNVITYNTASAGGGIFNGGFGSANMIINFSSLSHNTALDGAGIYNVGSSTTMTINNSTLSSNNTLVNGWGGGVNNQTPSMTSTLNDTTISGNTAYSGGGINNISGNLILNNSTITSNRATNGGGGGISGTSVTLKNSIVALDSVFDSALGPDCNGTFSSSGYNLIGDNSGCTFSASSGDLVGTSTSPINPRLTPLQDNGGTTFTHALLATSLAINAGNPSGCTDNLGSPLNTDQRGFPRFGRCDMGAYEVQPIEYSIKSVNKSAVLPNESITYTINLMNGGNTALTSVGVTDTLPAQVTYNNGSLTATGGSPSYSSGTVYWNGNLSAGNNVTITFGATANQPFSYAANSASISGGGTILTRTATVEINGRICNFTKYPTNPVLSIGASGAWDSNAVWDPSVLKEGSIYKMWYGGNDSSGNARIGYATSSDGINWTKYGSNPVLSPSATWEGVRVYAPAVINDSGTYKMWYAGRDSGGIVRIGYATSPDGMTWTKFGSNPVLNPGASGSWEDAYITAPSVVKVGIVFHMWYSGNDGVRTRIGHATSSDGMSWTKDAANPVLNTSSPGNWDWIHVYSPSVVLYNGMYLLWYSGYTLPAASQTGYAISSDGSTWTRKDKVISQGGASAFDGYSADYSSAIVDGAGFKVWYSGLNGAGTYTIGYATADVCGPVTQPPPPTNPVYLPMIGKNSDQTVPTCPAYYTDNFGDSNSGWPTSDDSNRRFAYVSGEYQIWVKVPSQEWSITPGAMVQDFTASVTGRLAAASSGMYGMVFGINEGWTEFYEVDLSANTYSIWKYNGTWTALKGWTASGFINAGTTPNRLKVIRSGTSIAVYVNSQYLTTVTDGSFTALRRIGLTASSPSNGAIDARFDDFSLYPATCGPSALAPSRGGTNFQMGKPESHGGTRPPK